MRETFLSLLTLMGTLGCNRSPGKQETFIWMQQTLAAHNGIREELSGMDSADSHMEVVAKLTFQGCQVEYLTTKTGDTVHVNMTEVDPNSAKIQEIGKVPWVVFKGRNSQRVVKYIDPSGTLLDDAENGGFSLDSPEYANSFLSAFKHAVILCGGKPSTF